jgi:hypothetical protein
MRTPQQEFDSPIVTDVWQDILPRCCGPNNMFKTHMLHHTQPSSLAIMKDGLIIMHLPLKEALVSNSLIARGVLSEAGIFGLQAATVR